MGDILKEAIADAKAVRETALENAKMALEEAFTPQIKSMLSAKLKEEELEEDEVPVTEEEDEDEAEEGRHEEGEHEDEDEAEEGMREEDDEEEVPAEEGEGHDDEVEEDDEDGEEVEEEALDLEAVIKELEAELSEGEDEEDEVEESTEAVSEGEDDDDKEEVEEEYEIDEAALTEEDDDEDKDEVDEELDKSSDIGKGDNNRGTTDASSAIGGGKKGMTEVQAELKEYKEAVSFLKGKLHEVNILNAKLLFTNKLFKAYSLDNNQKLKVVETFDRAQTTREIKLVYSTLAEQFNDNGSIVTRKSIKESASTPVASTKPAPEAKKVITEEAQVANRFKKLAGLIK